MQVKWPEVDPLQLRVEQDGEQVTLMTYRYPVAEGLKCRGVIFYFHGLGGYCEHSAYLFKGFAENGYDCFALDQRGFGNSGGQRGLFESESVVFSDLYLFILKAIQKYKINQQVTPIYLYGKSLGGLLAFNFSIRFPGLIRGVACIAPFFQQYKDFLDKYAYALYTINFFKFFYSVDGVDKTKASYPAYCAKYPHLV